MKSQPEHAPPCRNGYQHAFTPLGTEDNGEKVSRCGSCMTRKYETEAGAVRYEAEMLKIDIPVESARFTESGLVLVVRPLSLPDGAQFAESGTDLCGRTLNTSLQTEGPGERS